MGRSLWSLFAVVAVVFAGTLRAENAKPEAVEFFENKIRPVLAERCYSCHSAGATSLKGGLRLDAREGVLKGGTSGKPAVVPGDPPANFLPRSGGTTRPADAPEGEHRLIPQQVADFEAWVGRAGSPRRWNGRRCAERQGPLGVQEAPGAEGPGSKGQGGRTGSTRSSSWPSWRRRGKPSPTADKRTLIRRATFDLTGLPPTPEEVAAFEADTSPDALQK